MRNPLWGKRNGERECLFIRLKEQVKISILIRSDPKCFETFKILHWNLLIVNGDNKSKQIYKKRWTEHFLPWLGFSKNKQTQLGKLYRSVKPKLKTDNEVKWKRKWKNSSWLTSQTSPFVVSFLSVRKKVKLFAARKSYLWSCSRNFYSNH